MKPSWQPNPASEKLEKEMEAADLCESDRDEVRRFAEVLRRIDARKKGQELPPAPEGMREWLQGGKT